MYLLYNLLQILLLPILAPLLLLSLGRTKYRIRLGKRLGVGLSALWRQQSAGGQKGPPVIWIHALSVGETTSALPLVRLLREQYPDGQLVFTVTTRAGEQLARKRIGPYVDILFPSPLDLQFTIRHFIRTLQPHLFILVETDFWPNWLFTLQRKNIPALLVNGRVSKDSVRMYRRFPWFFTPLFSAFSLLFMQTRQDAENMKALGVAPQTVCVLGNLKADMAVSNLDNHQANLMLKKQYNLPENKLIWICGSTHGDEEQYILSAYEQLVMTTQLTLIIAPRNIKRAEEICVLGKKMGFRTAKRSEPTSMAVYDILILDTIGELARLYQVADLVFIGGSLVPRGGHNPLEAAAHGKPIIFGPYMDDFSEIAAGLVQCGGGRQITTPIELTTFLRHLIQAPNKRVTMGRHAREWMLVESGTGERLLEKIKDFLP
ncbi:MAG: hypothetical protein CSA33_07765 [Desulfobulbus propionicus]|nr:MAG: hypothetical protein CSA33_07765 [Desulfobulbus propionicus]